MNGATARTLLSESELNVGSITIKFGLRLKYIGIKRELMAQQRWRGGGGSTT